MNMQILTKSEQETRELAEMIARKLRGGEVLELVGDLGAGKTAFTKGLALGIDSVDEVSSPTFTVCQIYKGTDLEMRHYDFYRLGELGLMSEDLSEGLDDERVVTVIEWAKEARDLLPADRTLTVDIKPVKHDENQRVLDFSALNELADRLLVDVKEKYADARN